MMRPPNLLFIDMETSSLWRDKLSLDDSQQPWAVSVAFALCHSDGDMQNFGRLIVKPEGRVIQEKAGAVHGITTREASQFGIPEARMLGLFSDLLKTMPLDSWIRVVSYGTFDPKVLSSLFARFAVSQGKPSNAYDRLWLARPFVEFIDLMQPWCQQLCKLPPAAEGMDYKWPTLDESAVHILGREPRGSRHDAWQDMLILRDLYLALRERGHFAEPAAA